MKERLLVPAFLKKIDTWLLKNKPAAWSSRTHLVLYYAAVFCAVIACLCFISISDARIRSQAGVWSGFASLAAFTGFVVWLIFLLRFNVFKRFGNWHPWEGLRMFVLYFISITVMVFAAFIPYIVECVTANRAYTDKELIDDIDEINLTVCRLEYDILPRKFTVDTLELIKTDSTLVEKYDDRGNVVYVDSAAAEEPVITYRQFYSTVIDSSNFYSRIRQADSLKKISDSIFVLYGCPEYKIAKSYNAENGYGKDALSSFDIYNRVVKNYQAPNRAVLEKRMQELYKKYVVHNWENPYYNEDTYIYKIEKKYSLREITGTIDNIAGRKYWWQDSKQFIIRLFIYTVLILTMLLFVFRHCTVKTFFLTILAGVLLLIATAICMAIFDWYDKGVLVFMLLYYLLFTGITISTRMASSRYAIHGIALNFVFLFTTFVPLLATSLFFELRDDYNREHLILIDPLYDNRYYYLFGAEITGIVLFIILIEPVFRKLYKRWYSLPED